MAWRTEVTVPEWKPSPGGIRFVSSARVPSRELPLYSLTAWLGTQQQSLHGNTQHIFTHNDCE